MTKKNLFIIFVFILTSLPKIFGQWLWSENEFDIGKIENKIALIELKRDFGVENLKTIDSLLEILRVHYEFKSYEAKYNLASTSLNRVERILLYKQIKNFPFYTVTLPFYDAAFAEIYRMATRNLIFELAGNLDELKSMEIIPSMQSTLYGFLKIEIEKAGGEWDRGEIPIPEEILRLFRTKN